LAGSGPFLQERVGTEFWFPEYTLGIPGISRTAPAQRNGIPVPGRKFLERGSGIAGTAAEMHNLAVSSTIWCVKLESAENFS
jgi:hypothetical protein